MSKTVFKNAYSHVSEERITQVECFNSSPSLFDIAHQYEVAEIPGKVSAKQSVCGFKLLGSSYLYFCVCISNPPD